MFKFLLLFLFLLYLFYRIITFIFKNDSMNKFYSDSNESRNIDNKNKNTSKDSGEFVDYEELD